MQIKWLAVLLPLRPLAKSPRSSIEPWMGHAWGQLWVFPLGKNIAMPPAQLTRFVGGTLEWYHSARR